MILEFLADISVPFYAIVQLCWQPKVHNFLLKTQNSQLQLHIRNIDIDLFLFFHHSSLLQLFNIRILYNISLSLLLILFYLVQFLYIFINSIILYFTSSFYLIFIGFCLIQEIILLNVPKIKNFITHVLSKESSYEYGIEGSKKNY